VTLEPLDVDRLRARRNVKWSAYPADVLPAWIADMDFAAAAPIREFMQDKTSSSDFCYPLKPPYEPLQRALGERMQSHYGWTVDTTRIEIINDVIQGIYIALQTYGERGQGAVIQTPIYPPFLEAVHDTGRPGVFNPLIATAESFEIDFEGLSRALSPDTRFLLLCNPHNPTGLVLDRGKLEALAEIALRHDLVILSDEIHADLVFPGRRHLPIASLAPEIEARTVTFVSATKAYNMAGLRCAMAIFGSETLHREFNTVPRRLRGGMNAFGVEATRIAWTACDEWLHATLAYLQANRDFIGDFARANLPGVAYRIPQSTFFAWFDCRSLGLGEEPYDFFLREAKVALMPGPDFGPEGAGWTRLNFATSREILGEILERMSRALSKR
jgi:cystathionine beta-lyase